MKTGINNFIMKCALTLFILAAVIVTTHCGGGGGGGGTDSDGTGTIEISDIEGLWTIYFTDDNADTVNRMQVIYLMDGNDGLCCLVEESSEVKEYNADLRGSSISMNWDKNGSTLNFEGVVSDGKMTGTWDESNSGSGTWEAIYGLDLKDAKVTLGDGQEILLIIEEADDFGSSTFYGTDPGDGSDPLVTKVVVQMDGSELTIDSGNDGQIMGIAFADTKVRLEYNIDDSFDYEIRYKDEVTYSGVELDVDTNSSSIYNISGNTNQPIIDKSTLIKLNSEEENTALKPTLKTGIRIMGGLYRRSFIYRGTNKIPFDEIIPESGEFREFKDKMINDNQVFYELLTTYTMLADIHQYRLDNIEKLCENSNDPECQDRALIGSDLIFVYLNFMEEVLLDMVKQEWDEHRAGTMPNRIFYENNLSNFNLGWAFTKIPIDEIINGEITDIKGLPKNIYTYDFGNNQGVFSDSTYLSIWESTDDRTDLHIEGLMTITLRYDWADDKIMLTNFFGYNQEDEGQDYLLKRQFSYTTTNSQNSDLVCKEIPHSTLTNDKLSFILTDQSVCNCINDFKYIDKHGGEEKEWLKSEIDDNECSIEIDIYVK